MRRSTGRRAVMAAIWLGSTVGAAPGAAQGADPLTRPIEVEFAARWLGEIEPLRLFGNSYFVGFAGLGNVLIDTGDGLILIDGAVPQAVERLKSNIVRLGFRVEDVKYILSTEPHYDHAGGIAALERDSGALVLAAPEALPALRTGRAAPDDPQHGQLAPFPAPRTVRAISDGETIRLGNVEVTAVATPGHTDGSMSWTWRACEGETCRNLVFGSSLNAVAAEGFRFTDPAQARRVATFRTTFARFRALPCDLLITAHVDEADRLRRAADGEREAMVDPRACRSYADRAAARLDRRLAEEMR